MDTDRGKSESAALLRPLWPASNFRAARRLRAATELTPQFPMFASRATLSLFGLVSMAAMSCTPESVSWVRRVQVAQCGQRRQLACGSTHHAVVAQVQQRGCLESAQPLQGSAP